MSLLGAAYKWTFHEVGKTPLAMTFTSWTHCSPRGEQKFRLLLILTLLVDTLLALLRTFWEKKTGSCDFIAKCVQYKQDMLQRDRERLRDTNILEGGRGSICYRFN